jgi:hypothetical protein
MLSTQLDLLEVISGDLRKEDKEGAAPATPEPPAPPPRPSKGGIIADDDMIDDVPPQPVILP